MDGFWRRMTQRKLVQWVPAQEPPFACAREAGAAGS